MIKLSASAISDYLDCPMRYQYRRYHSDRGKQTPAMLVGSVVHDLVEKHWDNEEDAFKKAEEYTKQHGFSFTQEAKINTSLKNFFAKFRGLLSDQDVIEYFFSVNFSDDVKLIGKYDRVLPGGVIIDWKTGAKLPKDISNNIQFMLYYQTYTDANGVPPAAVILASLTTGKTIHFAYDETRMKFLYEEIIPGVIKNIQDEVFPPFGAVKYFAPCRFCSFNHCCRYYHKEDELDSRRTNN